MTLPFEPSPLFAPPLPPNTLYPYRPDWAGDQMPLSPCSR